jgi:DNA mismatch repair protein MLH3
MTFHNSKVISRNAPALPEQRFLTFKHGTRVIVSDLFGSMAVRVKLRAAAAEKAAVDKEWNYLLGYVVSLLLAWPGRVSVTVRETVYHRETKLRPSGVPKSLGKEMESADEDLSGRMTRLLTQSLLADAPPPKSWVPVVASLGGISVRGCMSLTPIATRRAQFISFGIHPMLNEYGSNILYEEINRQFSNSTFASVEDNIGGQASDISSTNVGNIFDRGEASGGKDNKAKRNVDRHPAFYLQIRLPQSSTLSKFTDVNDILDERGHNLAPVLDLIKDLCHALLEKYSFRSKRRDEAVKKALRTSSHPRQSFTNMGPASKLSVPSQNKAKDVSRKPTLRSAGIAKDSPFDSWPRVKVGQAPAGRIFPKAASRETQPSEKNQEPIMPVSNFTLPNVEHRLLDSSGRVQRRQFGTEECATSEISAISSIPSEDTGEHGGEVQSESELSNAVHGNSSHNFSSPQRGFSGGRKPECGGSSSVPVSPTKRIRVENRGRPKGRSEWVRKLLANWENPVSKPAPPAIPRPGNGMASVERYCTDNPIDNRRNLTLSISLETSFKSTQNRLSKELLSNAQIVSQVDKKFILAKFPLAHPNEGKEVEREFTDDTLLVMVDQHAADERCKLEALLKDYFAPCGPGDAPAARTELLGKPLHFQFSSKECLLLERFASHFGYWGIRYKLIPSTDKPSNCRELLTDRVEIYSLPPSILERCQQEPKLLFDLLRREIWELDENRKTLSHISSRKEQENMEQQWITLFNSCPQGILDLLNSRACRSKLLYRTQIYREANTHDDFTRCNHVQRCAHFR